MRGSTMLLVVLAAVAVSVAVWHFTGGRFAFFFLPLLFALPLFGRRR
ncbi:MAG TPA: hypothetical protein VEA15_09430 [Caulobacteraceae bacterium]|nr:hypothetical protein [Caulobacteraceae bacterium]